MKDAHKITNVHTPIDEMNVVNKEYFDNNLLSSSNKIDILCKNITELRKRILIKLHDMFTATLIETEEVNKKTNSAVDEALIKIKRQSYNM